MEQKDLDVVEIEKVEEIKETSVDVKKTFEDFGLEPALISAIKAVGWESPTKIQEETIPYGLQGRDIIGLAKTGSGKTGAFCIPMLNELLKKPQSCIGIIISPVRELAYQIGEQIEAIGTSFGVTVAVLVGGLDVQNQAMMLARKPHIIVGTPGRIVYHLENTKGFHLRKVKFLVMDEADRLLNMDFEEEINTIVRLCPKERTTYLFSATMTSKVGKLQRASLIDPIKVEVNTKNTTVDELIQHYIFVPEKYKDCYLVSLLNEFAGNMTIIFTIQCNTCHKLALTLRNLGFESVPLHGKMTQSKRLGALNKFKAGERKILVATDVASRGIDIPGVDLVLNYEMPQHNRDYIHRVGRTARIGNAGRAINIVTQYDVEDYKNIENHIGMKLDEYPTDRESALLLLERVSEAQRIASIEIRESGYQDGKRKSKQMNQRTRKKRRMQ